MSNHELNATEIFACAKVDRSNRLRYLKLFSKRSIGNRIGNVKWVPFEDGVYLCHAVDLLDTLRPLLLESGKDLNPSQGNYLLDRRRQPRSPSQLPHGFASLACGEHKVIYIPKERLVNARHVVNLSGTPTSKLTEFLARYPNNQKVFRGHQRVQGTYVTFTLGQQLLQYLEFVCVALQELLEVAAEIDPSVETKDSNGDCNDSEPGDADTNAAACRIETSSQILAVDDGQYHWSASLKAVLGWEDTLATSSI